MTPTSYKAHPTEEELIISKKFTLYLKRPVTYHLLPEIITTVIRSAQKNLAIFKALN